MRALVGLGNPGKKYEKTRHNAGSLFLDHFLSDVKKYGSGKNSEYTYYTGRGAESEFVIIRPETYMNHSGYAVIRAMDEFSLQPEDLLVIYDDMDLPSGEYRIKAGGGDGGHNGIKSITACIGTRDYPRLRLGIGKPAAGEQVHDFVLSPFTPEESEKLKGIFIFCSGLAQEFLDHGIRGALNLNSKLNNQQKKLSAQADNPNTKQDSKKESGDI